MCVRISFRLLKRHLQVSQLLDIPTSVASEHDWSKYLCFITPCHSFPTPLFTFSSFFLLFPTYEEKHKGSLPVQPRFVLSVYVCVCVCVCVSQSLFIFLFFFF